MQKINVRKITVTALVGFCFWVCFERIHDFYVESVPVGNVGECYSIKYPGSKNRYQLRILANYNQEKSSAVAISLLSDPGDSWIDRFSYFQIRMLDPKKMECK